MFKNNPILRIMDTESDELRVVIPPPGFESLLKFVVFRRITTNL